LEAARGSKKKRKGGLSRRKSIVHELCQLLKEVNISSNSTRSQGNLEEKKIEPLGERTKGPKRQKKGLSADKKKSKLNPASPSGRNDTGGDRPEMSEGEHRNDY